MFIGSHVFLTYEPVLFHLGFLHLLGYGKENNKKVFGILFSGVFQCNAPECLSEVLENRVCLSESFLVNVYTAEN